MTEHLSYNDQPIESPSEDRFGVDPFARALAASIRKMQSPQGAVIGLNGPWGSGKSSAVNLCKHHLAEAVKANELVVIDFACWWFRGEDALALAFFRELYAGLGPSLGDKVKKKLPKLGARLLRAGALVGKIAEAAGAVIAGGIAEKGMEWLAGLIEEDETVEALHAELAKALREQKKRFLIVIDDIDRLSPDEALLIFRLVKSVGRLPNVMYLLVYDRPLAERIVSDRYPSEGPHYLEKIVQAAFELPDPAALDVQQHLLSLIESICGAPAEADMVRFMNIFYEGISPAMRTPRDVTRFTNSLSVSWPAVAGEVDRADFLALEMLRLLHPAIYRAIRQNKEQLSGSGRDEGRDRAAAARHFDELLFGATPPPEHDRMRRVLMRLFPVLESAWANMGYGEGFAKQWAMKRRVCSPAHFDAYFRFSIGDEVLTSTELDEFVARADDIEYVKATLRHALTVTRRSGGTKAAVWLGELITHAERVDRDKVEALLTALFSIADEINVEADSAKAFSMDSNEVRLHWLLRALTKERYTLDERSAIFRHACDAASLGWLADFTRSAWTDYHPREGQEREPPENCLTTEADAEHLRALLRSRIEAAAADGTLLAHRDLSYLLHWWADLTTDDGAAVHAWTSGVLASDDGVRHLAKAFTSYGWTQSMGFGGMGDVVAQRVTRVNRKGMARLLDLDAFRSRVEAVASAGRHPEVLEFLDAWRRAEQGKDD
ncbi:P-loop NTPase fold protein [Burkholderia pseudomallei]|uniref:KAP family P-loop NTPase fold protein n=1 Tax=Burkholderia pseudomallei TaxID=28450 RepID=UPI00016AE616|nr:P-loop NTPase fold protein [Burkholderia pseudomallei]AIO87314.1 AAA ATPase domain protein [Burkholderia pseudomallei]EEH24558.1 putative KAP P-loop domain protein [Burkholderia pseudomallei Pakistan 9]ONB81831.1 NTPase [Burkholderia pseudomallei]